MSTGARDRDAAGRPRNARPRDAAGRPMPHGTTGVEQFEEPPPPEGPDDAIRQAQLLLDAGRPFHAHEVFEAAWKAAEPQDRDLWRGLAQLAVGLTHAQRGNASGAVALLRRGADALARFAGPPPTDIDLDGLSARGLALAARIESAGVDAVTPADLRLVLRVAEPD